MTTMNAGKPRENNSIISWCRMADEHFFQPEIIIVVELIF